MILVQTKREFFELRRSIELTRAGERKARLLETIIGQHALVMVDLMRLQNRDALIAKLKDLQDSWTNILLYRSGQDKRNTRDRVTEREYRFQRTVYGMVEEFMQHFLHVIGSRGNPSSVVMMMGPGTEAKWVDFYGLLSPQAASKFADTLKKFQDYIRYVGELSAYTDPEQIETSAFYTAATACVVVGINLGAWLDLVL
jgi:hypothetical protein